MEKSNEIDKMEIWAHFPDLQIGSNGEPLTGFVKCSSPLFYHLQKGDFLDLTHYKIEDGLFEWRNPENSNLLPRRVYKLVLRCWSKAPSNLDNLEDPEVDALSLQFEYETTYKFPKANPTSEQRELISKYFEEYKAENRIAFMKLKNKVKALGTLDFEDNAYNVVQNILLLIEDQIIDTATQENKKG
ncbi:MAG: hypothetical protein ACK41O_05595 [Runella zeae]